MPRNAGGQEATGYWHVTTSQRRFGHSDRCGSPHDSQSGPKRRQRSEVSRNRPASEEGGLTRGRCVTWRHASTWADVPSCANDAKHRVDVEPGRPTSSIAQAGRQDISRWFCATQHATPTSWCRKTGPRSAVKTCFGAALTTIMPASVTMVARPTIRQRRSMVPSLAVPCMGTCSAKSCGDAGGDTMAQRRRGIDRNDWQQHQPSVSFSTDKSASSQSLSSLADPQSQHSVVMDASPVFALRIYRVHSRHRGPQGSTHRST